MSNSMELDTARMKGIKSSRKIYVRVYMSNQGFTLIEIVVVLGILVVLSALGLFVSMDMFRGNSLHAEKNMVVSILQKARSRAMNNINEEPHGVHFESGQYVIFQGAWPSAMTEQISASAGVGNSGLDEVVFEQLTGNAACTPSPCSLVLTGEGGTFTVTIYSAGAITWE